MKLKTITILVLIFLIADVSESIAQTYTPPSRELVEQLLDGLEKCKENLANAEKGLAVMKKNPTDYSLETYLWVEGLAKEASECITDKKKQLDTLRKDYPGWFNSPTAFVDIDIHGSKLRSPKEMEAAIKDIKQRIDRAIAQFKDFQKPE